jgi:pyruvate/2-oxoglutarate dehydrogenase complex dihydrolipoamide acyltransferase (E2) component
VEDRPAARDGEVVVRPLMIMTLTCDHRALDGATASDFLRTVKSFLEEPGLML